MQEDKYTSAPSPVRSRLEQHKNEQSSSSTGGRSGVSAGKKDREAAKTHTSTMHYICRNICKKHTVGPITLAGFMLIKGMNLQQNIILTLIYLLFNYSNETFPFSYEYILLEGLPSISFPPKVIITWKSVKINMNNHTVVETRTGCIGLKIYTFNTKVRIGIRLISA